MKEIGFKNGASVISTGQIALLVLFLILLCLLSLYLRRKPEFINYLNKQNKGADVVVYSKSIGSGVTWYKVQDKGKTYVFVNNSQHLLKLDQYATGKDVADD